MVGRGGVAPGSKIGQIVEPKGGGEADGRCDTGVLAAVIIQPTSDVAETAALGGLP